MNRLQDNAQLKQAFQTLERLVADEMLRTFNVADSSDCQVSGREPAAAA